MLPEPRAVIFDLDDTLYPFRRYHLGGFAAVSAHLARNHRLDATRVFRHLVRTSKSSDRGREIQTCLVAFGLPQGLLDTLVRVVREHHPRLKFAPGVTPMFSALRSHGFRLGILTNGPREVQARKAAALGLPRYVDTIVYATDHGSRVGKPDPAAFAEVLSRLNVPASHAVMVGDDERCDVEGGRAAGLVTVRSSVFIPASSTSAHGLVDRFSAIAPTICRLLEQEHAHHAA